MYQLLINENTSLRIRLSVYLTEFFDEPKFKQPVVWTKKQSQLIYFVHSAFKADNPLDVGVKCLYCFRLQNEKVPNRQNMVCNYHSLVKNGLLNTYDTELKHIANEYNKVGKRDTNTSKIMEKNNNNSNLSP